MAPSEAAEVANSYTPNDLDVGKGGEPYGLSGNSGELAPILPLTLQFVIAMIARFWAPCSERSIDEEGEFDGTKIMV